MNNVLYPGTGRAVVTVLERLGHQVQYVDDQTCCGQMHLNAGYRGEGLTLARRVLADFGDADAVVIPSGSCTSTMRHLWGDVASDVGDRDLVRDAHAFAPRVYEFSEFLVDVLGVTDVGATFARRVTYHPTCHSLRSLRVGNKPLQLLRAVKGLELVELPRFESCCGFGGLFALKNAETSAAMGWGKLDDVYATDADVLCTSDNSCLTHLSALATKAPAVHPLAQQRPLEFKHLAEILASTGG